MAQPERPEVARMYDHLLGGTHNRAVDRAAIDTAVAANPGMRDAARGNRAFLGRVVRWCAARGVDQFLDLGSGIPSVGNVHEIAPAARVAYVDHDATAVAVGTELVADLDTVTMTRADVHDPSAVLAAPAVTGLLDLDRPVALLAMAVLHFYAGDARALLARYHRALAPGSVVALSHVSDDQDDPDLVERIRASAVGYRATPTPVVLRSRAELREALADLDVVDPGLVEVVDWPAPTGGVPTGGYGAVALVR